jgi:hypothetical protein
MKVMEKRKDLLASTWLFQLLNWALVILYFMVMVSHWSPDGTLWKLSQLDAMPGIVGELVEVESVVVGLVVVVVVVVLVDGVGSSVVVPTTQ